MSDDFRRRLRERVGAREPAASKGRVGDWNLYLGPMTGVAGQVRQLTVQPQYLFRVEKFIATDDATPQGSGTKIKGIFVGATSQLPPNVTLSTTQYLPNNLGSGWKWDTCYPAIPITVVVEFLAPCTFNAALFGKAII